MTDPEYTEPLSLGVSVADASYPALHLNRQVLTVAFVDWQDKPATMIFRDAIALRWQEADRYIDSGDRYDGTFVVRNSEWLAEHDRQRMLFGTAEFRHLKLNFNAAGILEVLCTEVELLQTPAA